MRSPSEEDNTQYILLKKYTSAESGRTIRRVQQLALVMLWKDLDVAITVHIRNINFCAGGRETSPHSLLGFKLCSFSCSVKGLTNYIT